MTAVSQFQFYCARAFYYININPPCPTSTFLGGARVIGPTKGLESVAEKGNRGRVYNTDFCVPIPTTGETQLTQSGCFQGVMLKNWLTSNHKLTRASALDDAGSPILPAASKLEVEDLSSG